MLEQFGKALRHETTGVPPHQNLRVLLDLQKSEVTQNNFKRLVFHEKMEEMSAWKILLIQ